MSPWADTGFVDGGGGGGGDSAHACHMLTTYSVYFTHQSHCISCYIPIFQQSETASNYWFLLVQCITFISLHMHVISRYPTYRVWSVCILCPYCIQLEDYLHSEDYPYIVNNGGLHDIFILFSLLPSLVGLWYFVQRNVSGGHSHSFAILECLLYLTQFFLHFHFLPKLI